MKRFDFSQTGGFPLTQDRLAWMQDGYISAINALASLAGGSDPLALVGVELTAGTWNTGGTVSDGWVWHPTLGLMPFLGGTFTTGTMGVAYTDLLTPLTFQNNSQQNVQIRRVAKMVAGATWQLRDLSQNRWAARFGLSNRTEWQNGSLSGGTGEIKYMHDKISGMVHVRGHITRQTNQVSVVNNGFPWVDCGLIPSTGILPSENIYFQTTIPEGIKDLNGHWHINGNGIIDTTFVVVSTSGGSSAMKLKLMGFQPSAGIGGISQWTQYFDFSYKI